MTELTSISSSSELKTASRSQLEACRQLLDGLLEPVPQRDQGNTLVPLNLLFLELGSLGNHIGLLRSVHPDSAVREAAEEAEQEISRFAHEIGLNKDVYEAVKACPTEGMDTKGKRLVKHLIRDFHRAGVDRDDPTRERIRKLREELVSLGQSFTRNIVTDVRRINLEGIQDLEGLPEDYAREHAPGKDGKIEITTDYPDYNPFMTYARSDRWREELYRVFRHRAFPANLEVLKSIIERRHQLAQLLGYPSWAVYITEDKMIETSEAIASFIDRVAEAAAERAERELGELLELKRKDDPDAIEVMDWEKAYLEERLKKKRFHVDSKEVRSYFEYFRVKDGLLSLTEQLFGVKFSAVVDASAWHQDVEVLDVVENSEVVGRVYLDMHPRDGKFKHAAMFPLVAGVRGQRTPRAALVCNFPDPRRTSEGPALLEHDDVVTFFHEFGHLLHHLLGRDQDWVEFSGTGTEWDFVEVPSQLYEEWAWDVDVLQRFAVHHETGEVIPRELVERLRCARDFGKGLWIRHQMFYAALSHACYESDPAQLDTTNLTRELQNRYSPFRFVQDTYFQASFGHLDDYSALYYTYMWSLVIEKDLFQQFRRGGLLSRDIAQKYRDCILAPGGSKDAMDLVRDFLDREYTFEAFEAWLNQDGLLTRMSPEPPAAST